LHLVGFGRGISMLGGGGGGFFRSECGAQPLPCQFVHFNPRLDPQVGQSIER
jgi:hypothetical protein